MREVYRDTGLKTGLHVGATWPTQLKAKDVDFDVITAVGRLVKNVSDGSTGVVRSCTAMDSQGYSTLTATLSGGTGNTWYYGATYTLYITDTANKIISRTVTGRMSGLAYPKDRLVDGELPGWDDIPQDTMEFHKGNR